MKGIGRILMGLPPLTPEEEEREKKSRELGEERWRTVYSRSQRGEDTPLSILFELIRDHGVPIHMGPYVAARLSSSRQRGRPVTKVAFDPFDPDAWQHAFSNVKARNPYPGLGRIGRLSGMPGPVIAVHALRRRTSVYRLLNARSAKRGLSVKNREGRQRLSRDLRPHFIKEGTHWRVKTPKSEALRIVSKRWHIDVETLRTWEKQVERCEKEVELSKWLMSEYGGEEIHE